MSETFGHTHVVGATRTDRLTAVERVCGERTSDAVLRVDCHRRLRGPYTGLGGLLRAIVPEIHTEQPALVRAHHREIVTVAPELATLLGKPADTLTSESSQEERTRWYSRLRARRVAHGIVDLLRAYTAGPGAARTCVLDAIPEADSSDQEFVAIALRRLDPARLRLVVAGRADPVSAELAAALGEYARRVDSPVLPATPAAAGPDPDLAGARAFVDSDGTSDDPALSAAYRRLDAAARMPLHDRRGAELAAQREREEGEPREHHAGGAAGAASPDGAARGVSTLRLGAIPYHRLHGSAAATAGWDATAAAADYCLEMGFYDAALEHAGELTARADFDTAPDRYWAGWYRTAHALSQTSRIDEVKPIYDDLLARFDAAHPQMTLHYMLSMLWTRLNAPAEKDHRLALGHANTAVAMAGLLPAEDNRAFHIAFMKNGRALVRMHLGDLRESLSLVEDGIARLDRELAPDRQRLHRSVLHHNRAQLLARLGRPDEAMAEYDEVIRLDPYYQEYWFDRGNLRYELGRYQLAADDYEQAASLGSPFPELFQNRGALRAATGDLDGAAADYRYVLDLEPDHLDAHVCLASLLVDLGQPQAAVAQAQSGLRYAPDDARLHALGGLALLGLDRVEEAELAFAQALQRDDGNQVALVNRAVLACEQGRYPDALQDLTRALKDDPDNADLVFNLGFVHEAAGRTLDAVGAYTRALELPGADRAEVLYRRGSCHAGLGRSAQAHADYRAHLSLGPSPYTAEITAYLETGAGV
ncbi:Tetratricopeptide repeat-containing protein [Streptomyces sp. DvalAA-14]|uniref:tetratricopeptide repeat protein n=1 Tax=unclassified Streptomyces TaxID=2593676 RepID=UPI00081BB950|nr:MULTISPECIES: tetratricopeptide repeat protein [unclassified Streptomyces]MYS18715.1 tetratricopeptide repeat protein [Streptomyces sp. SID4948]SCD28017.1 Tetratricopeptide repeat-containing protein [Streptomyces sp. DvalAA-14]